MAESTFMSDDGEILLKDYLGLGEEREKFRNNPNDFKKYICNVSEYFYSVVFGFLAGLLLIATAVWVGFDSLYIRVTITMFLSVITIFGAYLMLHLICENKIYIPKEDDNLVGCCYASGSFTINNQKKVGDFTLKSIKSVRTASNGKLEVTGTHMLFEDGYLTTIENVVIAFNVKYKDQKKLVEDLCNKIKD